MVRGLTGGDEHELAERQIESFRAKLLDLSNRNKLLNFRHSDRSRTQARVVDELPAVLFAGLTGGKAYRFKGLGEPPEGTTLTLAQAAIANKIDPSLELGERRVGAEAPQHVDSYIQLFHFERDMERRLEGMRQEHLSSLQELGVPALYGVFGFLEWYERDDSTTPLLSPLVVVPMEIERRRARGGYSFVATGPSEECEGNRTLLLRLRRDHGLDLPSVDQLNSSGDLDAYLAAVERAVADATRWRVRRMVTVSALSYARQVMYEDLAAERWAKRGGRAAHPIVRGLLMGNDGGFGAAGAAGVGQPLLITDADATQVAAIQDALAGRSLVVKGPPGTGKSQTITNLIAAAIGQGKRVLFVAEKMAALDVVKKRLDDAGLAEFCLALHSVNAKKAEVIAALARSRDAHKPMPAAVGVEERMREQARLRSEMEQYLAVFSSPVGAIGMDLREVVWREQALRGLLDEVAASLLQLMIVGAPHLTASGLLDARGRLVELERAVAGLAVGPATHPWRFVSSWDPQQHRADVLSQAVTRWAASMKGLLTPFEGLSWRVDQLTLEGVSLLVEQLGDLLHIPAGAPTDLVPHLEHAGVQARVRALIEDVEARRLHARRIEAICAVDAVMARRAALDELLAALRPLRLQDRQTLGEAASFVEDAVPSAAKLRRAIERGRELVQAAGGTFAFDTSVQRALFQCAELAAQAGDEVLGARLPECLQESALDVLRRASATVDELRQYATEIDGVLAGWRDLGETELRRHATVLRTTGSLRRLFGGAYRASRAEYLRLATGRAAAREAMAVALHAAAEHLGKEARVNDDATLRATVGAAFRGTETDFALLIRVAEWGQRVRAAFPGADAVSRWARQVLFTGDIGWLHGLVDFCADDGPLFSTATGARSGDLATFARDNEETMARAERAISGASHMRFDRRTPLRDLADVASALDEIARLDAQIHAAQATTLYLVGYWHGLETDTAPIRAALATRQLLDEMDLPPFVASWLRGDAFAVRLERGRAIAMRARPALADERRARESARLAGVSLGELAGPEATIAAMVTMLDAAVGAPERATEWVQYVLARQACADTPVVATFVRAVEEAGGPWGRLPDMFEWCVMRSLGAEAMRTHAAIARGAWTGGRLDEVRTRIRRGERELTELRRKDLIARLASVSVPKGRGTGPRGEWTNDALLLNEIHKKKGHRPIRELVRRASEAILALTPCLMMSPLSVAQFLDDPELQFDLLVIDEASQLRPEDALGALLRARQAVIVGDEQQLPPTQFFRRAAEDLEEDDDASADEVHTESVLELATRVLDQPRVLQWHYRSRHESLIAFSNMQFYGNKLVVAPAPNRPGPGIGVSVTFVPGVYASRTNEREADQVVDTVVALMRVHPTRSVGVVALNQPQADLIRERLDAKMGDAEAGYVEKWKDTLEPFFVKNLENVQGDERDTIVVSLTFGPDAQGRVFQRFGPINGVHGHRRLNVLFSRAKHQLLVISSLRPEDVKVSANAQRGVEVLRDYIAYAAHSSSAKRDADGSSRFEPLRSELHQLGFDAAPDVGAPPLRLDLGVHHPADPSAFLAGVEVDAGGADDPSSTRDRDTTRPTMLENLGWAVLPTWTVDWLREPGVARRQLRAAIEQTAKARGAPMPAPPARVVVRPLLDAEPLAASARREVPPMTIELRAGQRVLGCVEVTGERIRVGRSQRCDVRVPDEYAEVAGIHVELSWEGAHYAVVDQSTASGTYVDGQRVARADLRAGQTYVLRLGVGIVNLRAVYGGPLAVAASGAAVVAGAPNAIMERLDADERQFLTLVGENGTMRLDDLAARLSRSRVRVSGMARQLRKKLFEVGVVLFRDETLPSGEVIYRRVAGDGSR